MKIIATLIGAGVLLTFTAVLSPAVTFREYKSAESLKLALPATPDSTDKENAFKLESLLGAREADPYAAAGWTTLVPEADGHMRLAGPAGQPELHTYTTNLRSPGFAKGKLVLNSTSRAAVRVNGKQVITKTSADSVAKPSESPIILEPQADNVILIDILAMPDDKVAPDFMLEFIPDEPYKDIEVVTSPTAKKRVSQATAIMGERVGKTSLSDDGKYLIYVTSEIFSDKDRAVRAKLIETASGKVLNESLSYTAEWIPNQSAYTTVVSNNGKYDVYKTVLPSMQTSLLAAGVPVKDFSITPDGKYLLYYKEVEPTAAKGPMVRYGNPDDRIPDDRKRNYIMLYDIKNRISTPVTYGGPSTSIMSITKDGRKLLYSSIRQTPDQYPFYCTNLVEVDLPTMKCDTLISDFRQTMTGAVYSPDGKKIFIIAGPDSFDGIGANYAPHEIGNDFDGQGFIFDIATRKAKAMTRDFDPALISAQWNYADGDIYFLGENGFFQYIYRLDPNTGKITKLDTDVPFVRSFSIADNNRDWLSYSGGSFTQDGEAYLMNLKNKKSRLIEAPLTRLTKDYQFGEMKPWNFTADDGTVIEGWMCLPPDFDPSRKYPLIVYYYGGTSPSNASFYHNYSPQVFASRDYVVYVINPSGTTGYGQEFSARHVNAWGKRTADEIIEGTKLFCKDHKFVNDKKIGCIGASYGGFMTMYLQTRTDIFAAAVSHAGISNVTSYWGEGFWGYSYNAVAAAKSYPWSNPDLFTKQGALFNADKIHTPILLLHGSEDTNVPIGESIQLFNALKILGRDVEFISVTGENHVIRGTENRIIWQNTIMAWFAKYLKDEPAWWNSLYGN